MGYLFFLKIIYILLTASQHMHEIKYNKINQCRFSKDQFKQGLALFNLYCNMGQGLNTSGRNKM